MLWEALLLAFRAIRRNKMRSILTILGIVIGVAAVIAMVTLGNGTTARVVSDISKLGSNLLAVRPGQGPGPQTSAKSFARDDAIEIARQLVGAKAVAPVATGKTTAIFGSENWNTQLSGTDDEYFVARQWDLSAGRTFSEGEIRSGATVCIIGQTVREKLFGSMDPLGQTIRLTRIPCEVVGVLAEKGDAAFGGDQDDVVLIPLRAYQRRVAGNTDVGMIFVSARDGVSTAKLKANIEGLLRERRRIAEGTDNDFTVVDMTEISNTLSATTTVLTGLLGAVAAVSLLVGGIGIMNIMLVSVTERTREIGIRLAVGALKRQVLAQFLVEAIVLSLLGGLIGVALGLGLAGVGVRLLNVPFVVSVASVIGAFLFSAAVGVVFGFFPARRAANLNPIDALRHE